MAQPLNIRALKDVNLQTAQALPAASGTSYSPTLDLATTTAYRVPGVEAQITVPPIPNLAATTNITFTLQHSPDGTTWTNWPETPALAFLATGASGGGYAGSVPGVGTNFKLPLGLYRYLRLAIAADASSGANTGVTASLALVF